MMKKYAFGVDLGGTTVKMALFTDEGELLDKWEIKTDTTDNGKNIIPDMAAAVDQKLKEKSIQKEEVIGIGVDVPGPVTDDGRVLGCVNLGWGEFDLKTALSSAMGLPCEVGNDANVAALGEMYKGGGEGHKNLVMITLGTGVGGGIILDGQILSGTHGSAGEIGHYPVKEDETECCGCGKKGCLEQYASANGVARVTRLALAQSGEASVLREIENVTAKDIFDAAKNGDAFALRMVEELGKTLGIALARIGVVTDPDVFVIGGGVSKAGSILTDVIAKYYRQYAFHSMVDTPIVLAKLGNDAGIYGAVKMILGKRFN